ncbi:phosphodiester glycosidase family protein [Desulfotomaculum sp. 1211_IL3151]|uniref:phosphodiester glycosidase family protein n=1 Tax=Desulfotomaculum sp. 1211_IL3151 TaxID=3084055 RepID=UPI002FDAAF00
MRTVNIFFLLLFAPVVGFLFTVFNFDDHTQAMGLPLKNTEIALQSAEMQMEDINNNISFINQLVEEQERLYREQEKVIQELSRKSSNQIRLSDQIYEERILAMLGPPVGFHQSDRVEVKVFKLDELGYRGYIAKVKLHDPLAFRVVLAQDKYGEKETPWEATSRTGAILGVNGGGFYRFMQDGREYTLPIGNTVIDGKLVGGFQSSVEDIFFSGIKRDGELIGGIFFERDELLKQKPWQGVSFVPILIQDGKPVPLPRKWQNTKHPRTIIGEYANGDLILIVVDGRQSDWSSGVTLERLQIKLIELGVKEGYNLDGGGSSVFIFNGRVLNRPSDGIQRSMATNIVVLP